MSGSFSVAHETGTHPGAHLAVHIDDVEIARYVYMPELPDVESPKPYLHPVRTLGGASVSSFRPGDHPWHKGIQMTLSAVSGQNFWGGPSYHDGEYRLLDNIGRVVHNGFDALDVTAEQVLFVENLSWVTAGGERWIAERRTVRFHGVDVGRGVWMLDHQSEFVNVRGVPLVLGSPTTQGRPSAGYSGLFWRGARSFAGGEIIAADGRVGDSAGSDDAMGSSSAWLAVTARHDGACGGATVLVFAGSSTAAIPLAWFVRTDPYAAIAPSPSFASEVVIADGEALTLRHRIAVADRAWTRAELEEFATAHAF